MDHGGQDGVGIFVPNRRLGVFVVAIDVIPDRLLQLIDADVGAARDPLLTEPAEEALDQVAPGRGDRREWMW